MFHNVGQILVAILVLETKALVYYLPVLIISGLGAGVLIGLVSVWMIRRLEPVIRETLER